MEALEWIASNGFEEATALDYNNFLLKREPYINVNTDGFQQITILFDRFIDKVV
jgi:hypothetical protein